jgi:hypothetical protein
MDMEVEFNGKNGIFIRFDGGAKIPTSSEWFFHLIHRPNVHVLQVQIEQDAPPPAHWDKLVEAHARFVDMCERVAKYGLVGVLKIELVSTKEADHSLALVFKPKYAADADVMNILGWNRALITWHGDTYSRAHLYLEQGNYHMTDLAQGPSSNELVKLYHMPGVEIVSVCMSKRFEGDCPNCPRDRLPETPPDASADQRAEPKGCTWVHFR